MAHLWPPALFQFILAPDAHFPAHPLFERKSVVRKRQAQSRCITYANMLAILAHMAAERKRYSCAELEAYFKDPGHWHKHVTLTMGALKRACGQCFAPSELRANSEDLVSEAIAKLLRICSTRDIADLYSYLGEVLRNDVVELCKQQKKRSSLPEILPSHVEQRHTEEEVQGVIAEAEGTLPDPRDRKLLEMYVNGQPNRAMRAVDGRSPRQITRLRAEFADLLTAGYQRLLKSA